MVDWLSNCGVRALFKTSGFVIGLTECEMRVVMGSPMMIACCLWQPSLRGFRDSGQERSGE